MATKNKKFNPNDYEPITLMEPMLPDEANLDLEDLCVDLVAKSNALASKLDPNLKNSIADLVRSMNCYYSNLIEGHNTHPRDIEKALEGNLSKDPEKRNLQLEAKAHIYVQEAIDNNDCWGIQEFVSKAFISKIHEEFYKLLPEDLFTVVNIDTSEKTKIIPGKFRDAEVIVGRHIPPKAINLDSFMARFEEAYDIKKLSKLRQIIAVAASHHRLTWIHPFYDGNGRVARL
ncbi:MAG: Fic family protein, partial [Candidatus Caenarcaniphilales bacterium]|nr:Fic family protein [Candidatus Caenarcaniphilales bacterium]